MSKHPENFLLFTILLVLLLFCIVVSKFVFSSDINIATLQQNEPNSENVTQ
jgi:hypothetical protein